MKKILQKSYAWLVMLVAMFAMSTSAMADSVLFEISDFVQQPKEVTKGNVTISSTSEFKNYGSDFDLTAQSIPVTFTTASGYVLTRITTNHGWGGLGSPTTGSVAGDVWTAADNSTSTVTLYTTGWTEFYSINVEFTVSGSEPVNPGSGGSVTLKEGPTFVFNSGPGGELSDKVQDGVIARGHFYGQGANIYKTDDYDWALEFISESKKIAKIVLTTSFSASKLTTDGIGTWNSSSSTWTGSENSVRFHANSNLDSYITGATIWFESNDNTPTTPSAPVVNAVQVQNAEVGKVYTLTMFNYTGTEYPITVQSNKIKPAVGGTHELFKCQDDGDGIFFITTDGQYLRNPQAATWMSNYSSTGLSTVYDPELVTLSFEAMPTSGSNVFSANAANNGCVAIHQARGTSLMGYTTFNNDGTYSGSNEIFYTNSATSAFILREVQAFPTSALGQEGEDYYGTYYANHAWEIPAGYEAYVVTEVEDGHMTLEQINENVVGANTAVILKGARSESLPIQFSLETGYTNANNMLYGAVEDFANIHEDGYKYYVMTYDQNGENLGFYWQYGSGDGSTVNCAAHKAYLRVPAPTGGESNGFRFRFEDVTAIETVATVEDSAIYNLQGQRVNATAAGVYVKNGKKFIVK